MFIACSGGKHLVSKLARKLGGCSCNLELERFPDTEIRVRLPKVVHNLNVYFVQSFYPGDNNINDKFVELLFAAHTAKQLGAKSISLISPYLLYLREDVRFKAGTCISAQLTDKLFRNLFKKIYVVEPHLHRFPKFNKNYFPNAIKISLAREFSQYIKKNIGNCLLVGPDMESEQWVKPLAKELGLKYIILEKQRFSSRKVKVKGNRISAEKIVIIDDIISSGQTLLEASKLINSKKTYFLAAHGLFAEGALTKLKKKGEVIVSNSIPSKVSKIDCSSAIARAIK